MHRLPLLASLFLLIPSLAQSQGYRLEPSRVVVEGTDWQAWTVTPGTVQVNAEGVQPQFIRDKTNAALDAPSFGGGIWKAGTRQDQAAQLINGQEDTYWEPDPAAPLEDWSVEIDLGRLVWAKRIGLFDTFRLRGEAAFTKDSGSQVLEEEATIAQAFEQLDFGVEALASSVGGAAEEIVDHVAAPAFDHLGKGL